MSLRSPRERVLQTLSFELGGILIVAPLYSLIFGSSAAEGFALIIVLSLAVLLWSPLHNTVFDWVESRRTGRLASDRPHWLRLIHAVSHEATSALVTLPFIMWIGGFAFWPAVALDIGLTGFYTVYAYVFHLLFDWLRPIKPPGQAVPGNRFQSG